MLTLKRLDPVYGNILFEFERDNQPYFETWVPSRPASYHSLPSLMSLLANQVAECEAGMCQMFLAFLDGELVGRFNLTDIEKGHAVVGYRIAENYAGQGIATEGLNQLIQIARVLKLTQLTAVTSETNVASQRVLEKAGFVATGIRENGGTLNDQLIHLCRFEYLL